MKHISKREYAQLITENRQRFYRIAYSYARNEHDALDIVSEATYKGLKNLKNLREHEYFLTWMTRIVINTALDDLRKRARTEVCDADAIERESGASGSAADETCMDLYAAMDLLKPEERIYIVLKYFEEYSFRDMAVLLELPESTIKSRTYECLKRMRLYMEGGKRHD